MTTIDEALLTDEMLKLAYLNEDKTVLLRRFIGDEDVQAVSFREFKELVNAKLDHLGRAAAAEIDTLSKKLNHATAALEATTSVIRRLTASGDIRLAHKAAEDYQRAKNHVEMLTNLYGHEIGPWVEGRQ